MFSTRPISFWCNEFVSFFLVLRSVFLIKTSQIYIEEEKNIYFFFSTCFCLQISVQHMNTTDEGPTCFIHVFFFRWSVSRNTLRRKFFFLSFYTFDLFLCRAQNTKQRKKETNSLYIYYLWNTMQGNSPKKYILSTFNKIS